MGLVFEVLLTVGLFTSFFLNVWAIRTLGVKVEEIDDDANKAFAFVGDTLGTVLGRVNAIEGVILADYDAERETSTRDVFVTVDESEDLGTFTPTVMGIDFGADEPISVIAARPEAG